MFFSCIARCAPEAPARAARSVCSVALVCFVVLLLPMSLLRIILKGDTQIQLSVSTRISISYVVSVPCFSLQSSGMADHALSFPIDG